MSVTAQVEPKDVEAVEAAVLGEIRGIREHGVSGTELDRAVTASEAERVFGRETVEGLALAYGRSETVGNLAGDREYLERLRSVSAHEVQAAARRYLTDDYVRLALVPKGPGP